MNKSNLLDKMSSCESFVDTPIKLNQEEQKIFDLFWEKGGKASLDHDSNEITIDIMSLKEKYKIKKRTC
jgi:hypothetical protein